MTYELAKQLKEAWFPDGGSDFERVTVGNWSAPTLSELIEACGDNFISLERFDNGFRATGMKDSFFMMDNRTPEEAVARLWLALNKH